MTGASRCLDAGRVEFAPLLFCSWQKRAKGKMKWIAIGLIGMGVVSAPLLYGQAILTPAQVAAAAAVVTQTEPLQYLEVPAAGYFYSASDPNKPPAPGNFLNLPCWDLNGSWLLDDFDTNLAGFSGSNGRRMEDGGPPSPGDGGTNYNGGSSTNSPFLGFQTNGLWLAMTGVTNLTASVDLFNATNYVYEIFSTESLSVTNNPLDWNIETEIFPATNQNPTPFTVPVGDRTNSLFLWARDWTGVTSLGNQTPEWWFYYWFGTVNLSDGTLDSSETATLLDDYQDDRDPNVIYFALNVTNRYFNTSSATVQITVASGIPSSIAAQVDNSDTSNASWAVYNSNTVLNVNLGSVEGWHTVWVGMKGLPANAQQTWQQIALKLVLTPPVLVVTNPPTGLITQPFIQVQGYSLENLASMSYDLSNSAAVQTGQPAYVTTRQFDTNFLEYTTNGFGCFSVPMAVGTNIVTLHATDMAGNTNSTNLQYDYEPSSNTNPPVITVSWPQNNSLLSGTNLLVRGSVSDPFANVVAQIVGGGQTYNVTGLVEQDGTMWIENIPLASGTNYLTISAANTAGYGASTNLTVFQSAVSLSITGVSLNDPVAPTATVSGTLSGSSDTVWVNGVEATNNGNGPWTALNVPVGDSGTAVISAYAMSSGGGSLDVQVAQDIVRNPQIVMVNCDWNESGEYAGPYSEFCGDSGVPGRFSDPFNDPMHWVYGTPGYNLYSDCFSTYGFQTNQIECDGSWYPVTPTSTYNYQLTSWDATGNRSCRHARNECVRRYKRRNHSGSGAFYFLAPIF